MAGITINGPSGIDTNYIIESLVALENNKVIKVKTQKNAYQVKIDAYSKLQTFIRDIQTNALNLKKEENFNLYKTTSSNDALVSLTGSTGAVAGSYDIRVFQLAQREKLISTDGKITSQSQKLSDFGINPGSFSINGIEIITEANDTVQDLRAKINKATDANGKSTGVTATVLKMSETNYRLVLTAADTGAKGAVYKDLNGGTFLQDLGIIKNAGGDKGIVTQAVQSADDIKSAFDALAAGSSISFGGLDHNGKAVSGTFIKTAGSTVQDLMNSVANTFHGMVAVSVNDVDGTLQITDKIGGISKLAVSSFSMGGADYAFTATSTGYADSTVLSEGKDAFYDIDGISLQSDKNSASGAITGVTLNFKKVSYDETVTVRLERDFDGIIDKIDKLFNTFNALNRYVTDATKIGTKDKDGKEITKSGDLAGDMTARSLLSQVREEFQKKLDITGTGTYSFLTEIGLKTNTKTGEFELDKTKIRTVLENKFDDVVSLFASKGHTDNPAIIIGTFSNDTEDGVYSLTEEPGGTQYRIQRTNPASPDSYLSDPRQGDVVMFKSGPANGLTLTAPAGSGAATLTFSQGLSGHLDKQISDLTDGQEGFITLRQQSWNNAKTQCDKRISELEARVEQYRNRLVRQFATMEQTLNQLNSQSTNMLSQLGYYKKS